MKSLVECVILLRLFAPNLYVYFCSERLASRFLHKTNTKIKFIFSIFTFWFIYRDGAHDRNLKE